MADPITTAMIVLLGLFSIAIGLLSIGFHFREGRFLRRSRLARSSQRVTLSLAAGTLSTGLLVLALAGCLVSAF